MVWLIILVLLAVIAIATVLLAVLLTIDWLCGKPLYLEEPVDPREVAQAEAYRAHMQALLDSHDVEARAQQAYDKVAGRVRGKFFVIDGGR